MSTIYFPWFGNREDKISKQLPKETIIVQETIGKIEVEEKTIKKITDRTNSIFEHTNQIQQIQQQISHLEQAKIDNNDEAKTETLNQLIAQRTVLIDKTPLRQYIQENYPWTTIRDLSIKLTTILIETQDTNDIINKIIQRFWTQTKTWSDCIQDTKEILFEVLWKSIDTTTIYAHSQWWLLLWHIYQSLAEKERITWNEKIEKIVLVTPVTEGQEAKDFHKISDWVYRQTYLHPWRDLIVTQEFLDSIIGTELGEILQHIASKTTIILGEDDPYLPWWNERRIQAYENQWYTVKKVKGDHYPSIIQ